MQSYFPYSHIISNICKNLKQSIKKHAYTGDWQIIDKKEEPQVKPQLVTISEIYY